MPQRSSQHSLVSVSKSFSVLSVHGGVCYIPAPRPVFKARPAFPIKLAGRAEVDSSFDFRGTSREGLGWSWSKEFGIILVLSLGREEAAFERISMFRQNRDNDSDRSHYRS